MTVALKPVRRPDPENLTVFVSSTSEDLEQYRAVARNVILDLNWRPRMMEHFGASPQTTAKACFEAIDGCDLVILVVAFRRGWVPSEAEDGNGIDSITALELAHARDRGIPVLAFLASESWPGNQWEDDSEARTWVKKFRGGLNRPAVFFEFEEVTDRESQRLPGFRSKLKEELVEHQAQLVKEMNAEGGADTGLDFFDSARQHLLSGEAIPFLGPATAGVDVCEQLAQELADQLTPAESVSLATAAEYCERLAGSRPLFLKKLRAALASQEPESSQLLDLLIGCREIPLVVSASFDMALERRLQALERPFVVISHILRSFEGENDGKILVLRSGTEPQICLADQIDLRDAGLIVYKPLGSPFLHDKLDEDLAIDTVVMTESDHLTFLGRLENQHTQVPTVISRKLRNKRLLFLGYGLDVWQYRLVVQVFQAVGTRGRGISSIAVREPSSPMEELAWRRLGTDLVRMSPESFALRLAGGAPRAGGE